MLFSREKKAEVTEQKPDATFGGIGKIIGEMWAKLSETEKQKYNDLAEINN